MDKLSIQTEAQLRFKSVSGFLKNAEKKYPQLSQQLPTLLSSMLGDKSFDPNLMVNNEDKINGGFAALGEWLRDAGFIGFEVKNLGIFDIGIKTGAKALANFPPRDTFFKKSGIDSSNWQQLQDAMVDLSKVVREALEVGYKPKQIISGLFIESTAKVGDERENTSLATREMLTRVSGNRLPQVNAILNKWLQNK